MALEELFVAALLKVVEAICMECMYIHLQIIMLYVKPVLPVNI
jgi:hypothetical protein